MLSWREPLVLSISDEEYGKVLTPTGTKKVAGGKLGQDSCHRGAAWDMLGCLSLRARASQHGSTPLTLTPPC